MSEKALKIVPAPEAKTSPDAQTAQRSSGRSAPLGRKRLRMILLVALPALAALIGGSAFYLMGGRYISTDNAYVGAQKVLITPDISGKIIARRRARRPARQARRRTVRARSRALTGSRCSRRRPSSTPRAATTTSSRPISAR